MDQYDEAVAYLTENPDQIYESWRRPSESPAGCLFLFATKSGRMFSDNYQACGCLTQVKCGTYPAETEELTEAIRADERVPLWPEMIRAENLPVFAEWQRRLDAELRNRKADTYCEEK